MKKKLLKGMLASASVLGTFAMATPVFAANETGKNTTVEYNVTESYTWTAPADFSFTKNVNAENKNGTVQVTKNVIGSKKKLQISLDPNAAFVLTDAANAGNTRTYTLKKGDANGTALSKGAVVLEVNAGTDKGSQGLTFGLNSAGVQKAGTYKGTLKFVSAIVPQA